jgi:hypothetical protein
MRIDIPPTSAELERRHRKATDRMALWSGAANNARSMGDPAVGQPRFGTLGQLMCAVIEGIIKMNVSPGALHHPACRCQACVETWEEAADGVEQTCRYYGVDPKRHSFGALQRLAGV